MPWIYSMKKDIKRVLEQDDVDLILNAVDATNLERNLYLTNQLMEFNKPIIMSFNMMISLKRGLDIDCEKLGKELELLFFPYQLN